MNAHANITVAQRRVLRALVAAGGSRFMGVPEIPTRTVEVLAARGWVRIERGGLTFKCPRTGIDTFTPSPSTVHITDGGRDVELRDRTGIGERS